MKNIFVLLLLLTPEFIFCVSDYAADLVLHNQTGNKGLIKLPSAEGFVKMGLQAQVPLWQLDSKSDDAVLVKFKGKSVRHALMNRTFKVTPTDSLKWGDLPKGRIELRVNNGALAASLEYQDTDGKWKSMELNIA